MKKIAVVVPSIRIDTIGVFIDKWKRLFNKHGVDLFVVDDTPESPEVLHYVYSKTHGVYTHIKTSYNPNILKDIIFNKNDGVRNLGFYIAWTEGYTHILTLDDDCFPIEGTDPIQDHLNILNKKVPTSWLSTSEGAYMRGFPYEIRQEAEVLVSHGVWDNVPDFDACTQLVNGVHVPPYPKLIVPKGIYFPMCIMNVMFDIRALPYMYQAPMGVHGFDRFADIWSGVNLVRHAEKENFAVATGYSKIWHDRASNVYTNLKKEAKGIGIHENFWQKTLDEMCETEDGEYFKLYRNCEQKWRDIILSDFITEEPAQ